MTKLQTQMPRREEPTELMSEEAQVNAYAAADFEAAHAHIMRCFQEHFSVPHSSFRALDLGCGSGDFTFRLLQSCEHCQVDALDGSLAMLAKARASLEASGQQHRARLLHCVLPSKALTPHSYQLIFSNSLLHHLYKPQVLWESCKQLASSGASLFVCDLLRPPDEAQARKLVELYASTAPEILRRDFYNSLLAAFTPEEIKIQLAVAGLSHLKVKRISDRHVTVYGRLNGSGQPPV